VSEEASEKLRKGATANNEATMFRQKWTDGFREGLGGMGMSEFYGPMMMRNPLLQFIARLSPTTRPGCGNLSGCSNKRHPTEGESVAGFSALWRAYS